MPDSVAATPTPVAGVSGPAVPPLPLDTLKAADARDKEGNEAPVNAPTEAEARSLWSKDPDFPPWRRQAKVIVYSWPAQGLVMAGIIGSILIMAGWNGSETRPDWVDAIDSVIFAIFLTEMLLKWVGQGVGLCGREVDAAGLPRDTYFWGAEARWNRLDFFVVCVGLLDFVPFISLNLAALRVVRVVRPLRALRQFRGMQVMLLSLVRGLPYLANVLMIFLIILVVFAIMGVDGMGGSLRRRCVHAASGELFEAPEPETELFCNRDSDFKGGLSCPAVAAGYNSLVAEALAQPNASASTLYPALPAAQWRGLARLNLTCAESQAHNPNFGLTHFDDIGHGLLLIFLIALFEDWEVFNYYLEDAEFPAISLFIALVILVTNFLLLNVLISVVVGLLSAAWSEYEDELAAKRDALLEARQAEAIAGTASARSAGTLSGRAISAVRDMRNIIGAGARGVLDSARRGTTGVLAVMRPSRSGQQQQQAGAEGGAASSGADGVDSPATDSGPSPSASEGPSVSSAQSTARWRMVQARSMQRGASAAGVVQEVSARTRGGWKLDEAIDEMEAAEFTIEEDQTCEQRCHGACTDSPACRPCCDCLSDCQPRLRPIVTHKWFGWGIMVLIVANSVTMVLDSPTETEGKEVYQVFEILFTLLFAVECALKLIAIGWAYWDQTLNVLDAVIVSLSVLALPFNILALTASDTNFQLLDIVRAVLIFRVLRLVRLMLRIPGMQELLSTAFKSTHALLNLIGLTIFTTAVYALLGMQLFGGRFPADEEELADPRLRFDTFFESTITLFVLITLDNWSNAFYNCMQSSAAWAAVPYIIVWIFFSGFVLTNWYVAVILENFEHAEEDRYAQQMSKFRRLVRFQREVRLETLKRKRTTLIGFLRAITVGMDRLQTAAGVAAHMARTAHERAEVEMDASIPEDDQQASLETDLDQLRGTAAKNLACVQTAEQVALLHQLAVREGAALSQEETGILRDLLHAAGMLGHAAASVPTAPPDPVGAPDSKPGSVPPGEARFSSFTSDPGRARSPEGEEDVDMVALGRVLAEVYLGAMSRRAFALVRHLAHRRERLRGLYRDVTLDAVGTQDELAAMSTTTHNPYDRFVEIPDEDSAPMTAETAPAPATAPAEQEEATGPAASGAPAPGPPGHTEHTQGVDEPEHKAAPPKPAGSWRVAASPSPVKSSGSPALHSAVGALRARRPIAASPAFHLPSRTRLPALALLTQRAQASATRSGRTEKEVAERAKADRLQRRFEARLRAKRRQRRQRHEARRQSRHSAAPGSPASLLASPVPTVNIPPSPRQPAPPTSPTLPGLDMDSLAAKFDAAAGDLLAAQASPMPGVGTSATLNLAMAQEEVDKARQVRPASDQASPPIDADSDASWSSSEDTDDDEEDQAPNPEAVASAATRVMQLEGDAWLANTPAEHHAAGAAAAVVLAAEPLRLPLSARRPPTSTGARPMTASTRVTRAPPPLVDDASALQPLVLALCQHEREWALRQRAAAAQAARTARLAAASKRLAAAQVLGGNKRRDHLERVDEEDEGSDTRIAPTLSDAPGVLDDTGVPRQTLVLGGPIFQGAPVLLAPGEPLPEAATRDAAPGSDAADEGGHAGTALPAQEQLSDSSSVPRSLTAEAMAGKRPGGAGTAPTQNTASAVARPVASTDRALRVQPSEFVCCGRCACSLQHPARALALRIIKMPAFEYTVAGIIVLSSILLAFDDYQASLDQPRWIAVMDLVFAVLFGLEMALRMFALGGTRYFSVGWNAFDAFIAFVSIAEVLLVTSYTGRAFGGNGDLLSLPGTTQGGDRGLVAEGTSEPLWLRLLRIGRCLRPLRLMDRFAATRRLVIAMWSGGLQIVNAALLCTLTMFAFSVMARDLFADAMGNCSDESVSTRELCRGVFVAEDGELALRAWQVPTANFDSMPSSLGTLARIVTLETWAPVMFRAMDIDDANKGPIKNNSPFFALFFIVFVFVVSFILLQLVLGIVLEHLARVSGSADMTSKQRKWLNLQRFVLLFSPPQQRRLLRADFEAPVPEPLAAAAVNFKRPKRKRVATEAPSTTAPEPSPVVGSPMPGAENAQACAADLVAVPPSEAAHSPAPKPLRPSPSRTVLALPRRAAAADVPLAAGRGVPNLAALLPGVRNYVSNGFRRVAAVVAGVELEAQDEVSHAEDGGEGSGQQAGQTFTAPGRPMTAGARLLQRAGRKAALSSRLGTRQEPSSHTHKGSNLAGTFVFSPSLLDVQKGNAGVPGSRYVPQAGASVRDLILSDTSVSVDGSGMDSLFSAAAPRHLGSAAKAASEPRITDIAAVPAAASGDDESAVDVFGEVSGATPSSRTAAHIIRTGQGDTSSTTSSTDSSSGTSSDTEDDDVEAELRQAYLQAAHARAASSGDGAEMEGSQHASLRVDTSKSGAPQASMSRTPTSSLSPLAAAALRKKQARKQRIRNRRILKEGALIAPPCFKKSTTTATAESCPSLAACASDVSSSCAVCCKDCCTCYCAVRTRRCCALSWYKSRDDANLLSKHPWFHGFITACIILNVIVLMMNHYPISADFAQAILILNRVFLAIFAAEVLIKWLGLGLEAYFSDAWDTFDFVLVAGSLIFDFMPATFPFSVEAARVFRVARLARVFRKIPSLRILFDTAVVSLGSLLNVTAVLFLFLFVFAVMGMELFGDLGASRRHVHQWSVPHPDPVLAFNLQPSVTNNSACFGVSLGDPLHLLPPARIGSQSTRLGDRVSYYPEPGEDVQEATFTSFLSMGALYDASLQQATRELQSVFLFTPEAAAASVAAGNFTWAELVQEAQSANTVGGTLLEPGSTHPTTGATVPPAVAGVLEVSTCQAAPGALASAVEFAGSVAPLEAINRHAHFRTFGSSLFILLRMATGGEWPSIYADTQSVTSVTNVYFFAFTLIVTLVILAFYLGSVLENFLYAVEIEQSSDMSFADIQKYKKAWTSRGMDSKFQGVLPLRKLRPFLTRLAGQDKLERLQRRQERAALLARLAEMDAKLGKPFYLATRKDSAMWQSTEASLPQAPPHLTTGSDSVAGASTGGGHARGRSAFDPGMSSTLGGAGPADSRAGSKSDDKDVSKAFLEAAFVSFGQSPFQRFLARGLQRRWWWSILRTEVHGMAFEQNVVFEVRRRIRTLRQARQLLLRRRAVLSKQVQPPLGKRQDQASASDAAVLPASMVPPSGAAPLVGAEKSKPAGALPAAAGHQGPDAAPRPAASAPASPASDKAEDGAQSAPTVEIPPRVRFQSQASGAGTASRLRKAGQRTPKRQHHAPSFIMRSRVEAMGVAKRVLREIGSLRTPKEVDAQIAALDAVRLEHVHAAAAAAVAARPEGSLQVPFGTLLTLLSRWKFGPDALSAVERMQRETVMARWVRHMLVSRVQSSVRGFLARRRVQRQFAANSSLDSSTTGAAADGLAALASAFPFFASAGDVAVEQTSGEQPGSSAEVQSDEEDDAGL